MDGMGQVDSIATQALPPWSDDAVPQRKYRDWGWVAPLLFLLIVCGSVGAACYYQPPFLTKLFEGKARKTSGTTNTSTPRTNRKVTPDWDQIAHHDLVPAEAKAIVSVRASELTKNLSPSFKTFLANQPQSPLALVKTLLDIKVNEVEQITVATLNEEVSDPTKAKVLVLVKLTSPDARNRVTSKYAGDSLYEENGFKVTVLKAPFDLGYQVVTFGEQNLALGQKDSIELLRAALKRDPVTKLSPALSAMKERHQVVVWGKLTEKLLEKVREVTPADNGLLTGSEHALLTVHLKDGLQVALAAKYTDTEAAKKAKDGIDRVVKKLAAKSSPTMSKATKEAIAFRIATIGVGAIPTEIFGLAAQNLIPAKLSDSLIDPRNRSQVSPEIKAISQVLLDNVVSSVTENTLTIKTRLNAEQVQNLQDEVIQSNRRENRANKMSVLHTGLLGVYTKMAKPGFPKGWTSGKGLSWRVAILPHIGEEELYKKFKLDEPWDSEHNRKLVADMPKVFRLPGVKADAGQTHYRIVVGPGAVFEKGKDAKLKMSEKIPKGNSVLVAESNKSVPWTTPEELSFDAKTLPEFSKHHADGFMVVLANGRILLVRRDVPNASLRAMLTKTAAAKLAKSVPILQPAPELP